MKQDITTQFTLGLLMPIKQRVLSGNPDELEEALELVEREESIIYRYYTPIQIENVEQYNQRAITIISSEQGITLDKYADVQIVIGKVV